jgi:ATP-binding cassette subfamily F protein uup
LILRVAKGHAAPVLSLLSAHGIRKSYAGKTVLDGASLTVEDGDRLGLIGINGAGKSTLLRILLGEEDQDDGTVQRKRGLTTAIVTQFPRLNVEQTVLENVRAGQQRNHRLRVELEKISKRIESPRDDAELTALVAEQASLNEELERAGGWNVEHEAEAVMQHLGVPPPDRIVSSLSQGEQRRVALAAGILGHPDLLVLDEPTNHIDVEAIEWLEEYLTSWPGALILVTHDRYFLDKVTNRNAELDRGDLRVYEGNYTEYLTAKAEREAMEAKSEHKRQRAIENELHWVRRRAPARTTKQRARLERFDELVAARPKTVSTDLSFRLPHPPRLGKTILEIHGVSKRLGNKLLVDKLDLLLKRGDRLGIVGPNGIGKTTLLRMINQELEPDSGEIALGQNTQIAYADQRRPLDENKTVLDEVSGDNDVVFVGDEAIPVYGFLEGLLFDAVVQRAKISSLSGGEKSRVALAKALRVTANLLILDEPTNDLDLPTLRVLEDALVNYPGCALIVSHDRYFLDRVATGILSFEGNGKVVLFDGGWEEHRARMKEREKAKEKEPEKHKAQALPPVPKAKPKKRSYAEEKELAGMEEKILEAEAKVGAIESELADPARARELAAGMKARLAELEAAKSAVEKLYQRWSDLSERG